MHDALLRGERFDAAARKIVSEWLARLDAGLVDPEDLHITNDQVESLRGLAGPTSPLILRLEIDETHDQAACDEFVKARIGEILHVRVVEEIC